MSTHTATILPVASPTPPTEAEQRIILHGVSWDTYERLLADFPESNTVRFTYDQGELEIMVSSFGHETYKDAIALLVNVVAEEMEVDVLGAGSTTFRRKDLAKGFEPDACFYIQHAERVRGKKQIDLTRDPPPDLVIEIDLTSLSLNKLPIYAAVRVPEIWRYDGQAVTILRLTGNKYRQRQESAIFPGVTGAQIARFIEELQEMKRLDWLRRVREWVRKQKTGAERGT